MMDWNTMDAAPIANAATSIARSFGVRIFMENCINFGLLKFTSKIKKNTTDKITNAARITSVLTFRLYAVLLITSSHLLPKRFGSLFFHASVFGRALQ